MLAPMIRSAVRYRSTTDERAWSSPQPSPMTLVKLVIPRRGLTTLMTLL